MPATGGAEAERRTHVRTVWFRNPRSTTVRLQKQAFVCLRENNRHDMFDPLDPWLYELCFPGAVSGEAEVTCPSCGVLLTVPVEDPMGSQQYTCPECTIGFKVNWGRG